MAWEEAEKTKRKTNAAPMIARNERDKNTRMRLEQNTAQWEVARKAETYELRSTRPFPRAHALKGFAELPD